jgi:hypothetical protein
MAQTIILRDELPGVDTAEYIKMTSPEVRSLALMMLLDVVAFSEVNQMTNQQCRTALAKIQAYAEIINLE